MREHEWPVLAEPSANARGACLPWNSRLVGLTPTSSASVPAPGGRPSGASFALHPPKPNHQGLRRARCEKISLLKQKVPNSHQSETECAAQS